MTITSVKSLRIINKYTGFSDKSLDNGAKTRPKTAYRPLMNNVSNRRNDALMVDNNQQLLGNPYVNTVHNNLKTKIINSRSRDTRAAFQSDASFDFNHKKSLVKPARTIVTKKRSRTQQRGKIVNYTVRFNN